MKERNLLLEQETATGHRATSAAQAVAAPGGWWARFTARIRAWFDVPFGYEDESGFHYGAQPAPQPARFATEATSFRARVLTDRADHVMRHSVVLPVAATTGPSVAAATSEQKAEPVAH